MHENISHTDIYYKQRKKKMELKQSDNEICLNVGLITAYFFLISRNEVLSENIKCIWKAFQW